MIRRLLLLTACLLAVRASAVVVDVNLPYKELRLKDGLLFTEVTVRSFNTYAGTVMLQVNKDLISVRTSMLPDDVSARLKALAPAQTKEELEEERKAEEASRARAAEYAERRQRQLEEEAKAIRAANRTVNTQVAVETATKPDATLADIEHFAAERARAYFKYRDDPFSNIGTVVESDIYLETPEPVPGWPGRYRVEGTAHRQYINNQISGFGRGSKDFEILIQLRDGKKPEIVELRIK